MSNTEQTDYDLNLDYYLEKLKMTKKDIRFVTKTMEKLGLDYDDLAMARFLYNFKETKN